LTFLPQTHKNLLFIDQVEVTHCFSFVDNDLVGDKDPAIEVTDKLTDHFLAGQEAHVLVSEQVPEVKDKGVLEALYIILVLVDISEDFSYESVSKIWLQLVEELIVLSEHAEVQHETSFNVVLDLIVKRLWQLL